jgi:hypothetical protein
MTSTTLYKDNAAHDSSSQFNAPVGKVVNVHLQGHNPNQVLTALGLGADTNSSDTSGAQKSTGFADSLASFGENGSYYLGVTVGGKKKRKWIKLPPGVESHLPGKEIAGLRWLSLGPGKNYFMTYDRKDGGVSYSCNFNNDSLKEWVRKETKTYRDLRVVFGPGNSFLAWQSGKGTKWRNIPAGLETAIKERKAPSVVALGANGAYIATWPGGKQKTSSIGSYPGLAEALDGEHAKITFVSLSPFGTYYYIQFEDGKVQYSAPWNKVG